MRGAANAAQCRRPTHSPATSKKIETRGRGDGIQPRYGVRKRIRTKDTDVSAPRMAHFFSGSPQGRHEAHVPGWCVPGGAFGARQWIEADPAAEIHSGEAPDGFSRPSPGGAVSPPRRSAVEAAVKNGKGRDCSRPFLCPKEPEAYARPACFMTSAA